MQNPGEVWNALLKKKWNFDLSVIESFITDGISVRLDVDITDEVRCFLNDTNNEMGSWNMMDEFLNSLKSIEDHNLGDSTLSVFFKDVSHMKSFVDKHRLRVDFGCDKNIEDHICHVVNNFANANFNPNEDIRSFIMRLAQVKEIMSCAK